MENSKSDRILFKAEECEYTSCYCEENVYKLCEKYLRNTLEQEEISNADKKPEKISKTEENEEISKNSEISKNLKNPPKPLEKSLGFAVFITNPLQTTYIRYQKSGKPNKHGLVIWDYHVIFLIKLQDNAVFVYDLDSSLDFPCEFNEYFHKALGFQMKDKPNTYFRVCESGLFLKEFSSDRSHMIRNGEYLMRPPDWGCIGKGNNFPRYLDLEDVTFGKVMNEREFYEFFNK